MAEPACPLMCFLLRLVAAMSAMAVASAEYNEICSTPSAYSALDKDNDNNNNKVTIVVRRYRDEKNCNRDAEIFLWG